MGHIRIFHRTSVFPVTFNMFKNLSVAHVKYLSPNQVITPKNNVVIYIDSYGMMCAHIDSYGMMCAHFKRHFLKKLC